MLLVKTILKPSQVHGFGIFAAEKISKGRLVFQFDTRIDRVWDEVEILNFPLPLQRRIYYYIWRGVRDNLIKYGLHGDDARFINHSIEPNLVCYRGGLSNPLYDPVVYVAEAKQDIAEGEELLWNYSEFDCVDSSPTNIWAKMRKNLGLVEDMFGQQVELNGYSK